MCPIRIRLADRYGCSVPEDQAKSRAVDPGMLEKGGEFIGFKEMPLMFDYCENSRGLGLADMCKAIETGRPIRSEKQQTLHVLEILTSFEKSSREGRYLPLETRYQRAQPMKNNPMFGILD